MLGRRPRRRTSEVGAMNPMQMTDLHTEPNARSNGAFRLIDQRSVTALGT